ncbi:Cytochrome b-c1 complex subunit 6 [Candida viswanathii]|uniref:Cytochrome b-c1 complex subunit 6, mitochondrial n=1 Tax=Candida viswanathii TaxID=5486 RepID=A0A367XXU0_9ASCO|nr:Cytochrome b-c1 complex subunit 6 [Candida viswanathii]
MSFFRDLLESVIPTAHAEEDEQVVIQDVYEEEPEAAPEEPIGEETVEVGSPEEGEEAEEEEAGEDDDDEDEDDDDEDDEDEEEQADPLDTLREECAKTAACKPFDHHFQECIERVTKEQEEEGYEHKHYKEDCVEEYFHLQHCVNDCVAPRLFNKLK